MNKIIQEFKSRFNRINRRSRSLLFSAASSATLKMVGLGVNFLTIPISIRYLNEERFGLWMTLISILTMASFADFGLGNNLINQISKADAQKSDILARRSISNTFFSLILIGSTLLIIFHYIYPTILWEKFFNIKNLQTSAEVGPTLRILFIIFCINLPLSVVQKIQIGYQKTYFANLWGILGYIFSVLGLIVAIKFKVSLPLLVLYYSLGPVLSTILNGFFLFSERRHLVPKISDLNLPLAIETIRKGGVFFLLIIFTLISNISDNFIITRVLGSAEVTQYEIVRKIFMFAMITDFFIQPLWPAFGEALESGDSIWIKKAFIRSLKLSLLIGVTIGLAMILLAPTIIQLWVGEEYKPDISLLFGFALFTIVLNYNGVLSVLLNSSSLVQKQLIPMGLTAIFSVGLKLYFTKKYGISGTVWGTVIAWSVFYIIPSYLLAKKIIYQQINKSNVQ